MVRFLRVFFAASILAATVTSAPALAQGAATSVFPPPPPMVSPAAGTIDLQTIVRGLRTAGISQADVDKITKRNPARFLGAK